MTALERLRGVHGFIVDLDGTIYLGNEAIRGAREFIRSLVDMRFRYLFVTNNSSTSGDTYVQKLRRLEIPVESGQVLTSGEATAMFLSRRGYRRLYVIGTPALEREMTDAGFVLVPDTPECVVLGYDKTLTYAKLEAAARFLRAGVPFVATHPDVVCPTETGYVPDCGSMIALLQAATGVAPVVVGKPEPLLVDMALTKLGLRAEQVAVIGDRLYTDIAMARRSGTLAILVLSGETSRETALAATEPPDLMFDDLGAVAGTLLGMGHTGAHAAIGRFA